MESTEVGKPPEAFPLMDLAWPLVALVLAKRARGALANNAAMWLDLKSRKSDTPSAMEHWECYLHLLPRLVPSGARLKYCNHCHLH
jgi:hypothetical protein